MKQKSSSEEGHCHLAMPQIGERPVSTTLNLTVFIGNGFDLSAGMKTGTAEFMDFFANKHERDGGPVGRLAKKILEDGHETGLKASRRSSESMLRLSKDREGPSQRRP